MKGGGGAEVVRHLKGRKGSVVETRVLAIEEPLVIHLTGGPSFTIMRTPGHDRELVAGFLLAEGLIRSRDDIAAMKGASETGNEMHVLLGERPGGATARNLAVLSSCGICGRPDVAALAREIPPVGNGIRVPVSSLYAVPDRVRSAQRMFGESGATHAAALFEPNGDILATFEDLGRHNALDKLVGHAVLSGLDPSRYGAFLSGRVSFEMVVKAARAGITVVAAVSASTDAAVRLARGFGVTLCGFVRGDEVTIYTRSDRVVAG